MKRTIIAASVLALGIAGSGAALADPPGPSINGNNNYGLCTAYQAQEDHRPGGPNQTFQDLEAEYDEAAGEDGAFQAMCDALLGDEAPGNSGGKGKKGEEETG